MSDRGSRFDSDSRAAALLICGYDVGHMFADAARGNGDTAQGIIDYWNTLNPSDQIVLSRANTFH